ncbi:alpha/beta hydrolase family protein [Rhodococcus sp. IEGM 1379]|uniref:alpha/beta hydrolase n=1 Tax=Rhodococcus sp. IEGM 1379 TaxID=3047086 RepID=UPI0024B7DE6F|nr:alpha/beta hydrolase family protein [Rhodococcus sp. IEGM 1379]MDI9916356.1 alpha/beta hydrolase family protein [Rhodococcus sp. IEGM 1379]
MKKSLTSPTSVRRAGVVATALCALGIQVFTTAVAGATPTSDSVEGLKYGSTVPGSMQGNPGIRPELRSGMGAATIVGESVTGSQAVRLTIASPALQREVGVEILLPADNSAPRPTLYLLDGAAGSEESSGWMSFGGAPDFFADKNVYVVMPNGGKAGMYTDWQNVDPKLGLHRWETFITEELPPLVDARFATNGVKAIAGTSMGAQGAMMLAGRHPGMYKGVAGFSGCYSTTDLWGRASILSTVTSRGGNPGNMWGELGGPEWEAHDSLRNAEQLRGTEIYLSVGPGAPGPHENLQTPSLADRLIVGGTIEAVANMCTHAFDERLRSLGIAATVAYEPNGTHSWGYWRDQLPKAWPTLSKALGI